MTPKTNPTSTMGGSLMSSDNPSVVIITWERGYVAHLRYKNSKKDENVASESKIGMYLKLERRLM